MIPSRARSHNPHDKHGKSVLYGLDTSMASYKFESPKLAIVVRKGSCASIRRGWASLLLPSVKDGQDFRHLTKMGKYANIELVTQKRMANMPTSYVDGHTNRQHLRQKLVSSFGTYIHSTAMVRLLATPSQCQHHQRSQARLTTSRKCLPSYELQALQQRAIF